METTSSILIFLIWGFIVVLPLIALDLASLAWGVDSSGDRGDLY